jgi:hypothetical protein
MLYKRERSKNLGNDPPPTTETSLEEDESLEEDDKYASSQIGNESVYSYFVAEKIPRWQKRLAFATLCLQFAILIVFIIASEANLQDDEIDLQFTWKCPRDTDVCDNRADLTGFGWAICCLLIVANLAKDIIGGTKLICHSAKTRHDKSSIRYFFGGMFLC